MLTKNEQRLLDQQTELEFKALVIKEVKRRIGDKPMCANSIGLISKEKGFHDCVNMIVSETHYYSI